LALTIYTHKGCHAASRSVVGEQEADLKILYRSQVKVEVKKKYFSVGRNFSCFAARLIERDLF